MTEFEKNQEGLKIMLENRQACECPACGEIEFRKVGEVEVQAIEAFYFNEYECEECKHYAQGNNRHRHHVDSGDMEHSENDRDRTVDHARRAGRAVDEKRPFAIPAYHARRVPNVGQDKVRVRGGVS